MICRPLHMIQEKAGVLIRGQLSAIGSWSLPGRKLHINYLGGFLCPKIVPRPLSREYCPHSNRQRQALLHKQWRGMRSSPLCALLWRILTWCFRKQVTLMARHIPGCLNVVADKLSRLNHMIQTMVSPSRGLPDDIS